LDIEAIKKEATADMEAAIKSVVDGTKDSVEIHFLRPGAAISFLEKQYGCESNEMETNGWQWDFWYYVDINDKKYCLAGDGYYQTSMSFRID
jgi:hypothetical protein